MTVLIRLADFSRDALDIVNGAREFAESTVLKEYFPKGEKFVEVIGRILTLDQMEILVAEHDQRVVGGIGIIYIPYVWNPELLVGEEIFWWASKKAPFRTGSLLINEAMKRIEERKAMPMFGSLTTSPRHVEKIYRRYGMSPIGTVHMRLP